MKLSEISGERTLSVIADLTEYIGEIAMDKKAMEFFSPAKDSKAPAHEIALQRIFKNLPYLIRNHEKALYSIFAILNDVDYEEYMKTTNIKRIIQDIKDLWTDEMIKELFTTANPATDEK